ncbi:methyltransferase family protein [Leucobacter salsicius]|uniref:methyltransferase family protein n=1 Tax=Leucobacter salsicius TaxID=664638 RepID=UPI0003471CDA|nr:isoprenylcysteine carboxylmethyltransferase family protein [Leucobacter salsicius]
MSPYSPSLARGYFAVQAAAAGAWWLLVFAVEAVRTATLGSLDPVLVGALDVPLFAIASLLVAVGARWAVWVVWPWTLLVTVALAGYATVTGLAGWGVVAMVAASAGTSAAALLLVWGRIPTELMLSGPLRIREARAASAARHATATGAQIVIFWGLFLVAIPLVISVLEQRWGLAISVPAWIRIAGGALLAAASALGIWSALAMSTRGEGTPLPSATARRLVVAGPYRFVRNPMALAGISQGVAVGLLLGSWLVVAYALAGSLVWNWGVRPHEEADLEERFGAEFRDYRAEVRCWVPRLRAYARR